MEAAAAAEQQKKQDMPSPKPLPSATNAVSPQTAAAKSIKHRKRRQRQKNEGGDMQIDVKRPNSVLVDTSIRALLTNYAFSQLSPENQKILIESLPLVDRPSHADNKPLELCPSSINNEFFNRACIEWRDRLAYGEFTNEHQTKLKAEQERDKSKIDPWKARNFEGIWGFKTSAKENLGEILEKSAMEVKGRMEQGDFEIPEGFISEMWKEGEQNSPPETVTSTQPDVTDSPARKSPSPIISNSPEPPADQPVIAEATSSADDVTVVPVDSPQPSTSNFIADDDDEVASHVELSSDGMPTQWYHQQEHDYLKNIPEMEPESSGMDMDMDTVGDIIDDTAGIELIENDNATFASPPVTRITNYDAELPREIFHKSEPATSPMLSYQDPQQFSQVVMTQDDDAFMMEEAEIEMAANTSGSSGYHEEIHVPKNVKVLTFPSSVNYLNNEKFIIEEQSQHIQQQSSSTTTTYRANGATIQPTLQNSYFVGGTNFAYISKMGNKIEATESTRIIKQEANNNQMKQRIIYEISTEPKMSFEQPATHHMTYAAPPQQEIYHKMVNHNGTTTIYTETTGPPQKKTIIQRKKPTDPYTVQMALQTVANNNTIILTPIGNATTQQVQSQPQKSIVHIHRTTPMQQPVQFLPQTTFLKKQTVLIPTQMQATSTAMKTQPPKYTTVIRAPAQQVIQTQQLTPIVSNPRPIQKQKVIMSTSSLQQYRSFNQKPNAHGSRKQLHPQHIIRPAPQTTTATVIQSMVESVKGNGQPIPVMISSGNATESFTQIPTQQMVSPTQTVVINSSMAPSNSIFVQKRPQQTTTIFQQAPTQQIFQQPCPMIQQQQQQHHQLCLNPRMRGLINHQRPPPGAVNLERSYQICQAVIQNSPNRHQLNCQLKPPPPPPPTTTTMMMQKKF